MSTSSPEQIASIGLETVESAVKQIDRRVKISGAQWNAENVPQVHSEPLRLPQWSTDCLSSLQR